MYQLKMFYQGVTYTLKHDEMDTINAAIRAQCMRLGVPQINYTIHAGGRLIAKA